MNHNLDQQMTKLPLPPELIVIISKYLNIQDKLKLRLINKSFKFVFDNLIQINRLTLVESNDDFYLNWFYTNRSNNINELVQFYDLNLLNKLFKNNLFSNKINKLFFTTTSKIDLNNTINQFVNLIELNIKCKLIYPNLILSLPKLNLLSINQFNIIELETPSLSFLRCENLKNYQFNYPEKIIYLDIKFKNNSLINRSSIEFKQFKNLEYLVFYNLVNGFELNSNFIKLKELHFNGDYGKISIDQIKLIYQHKLKLKLNDLNIFLYGIKIDYITELDEYKLFKNETFFKKLDLIFRNYSKTIDVLEFITELDFYQLYRFMNSDPYILLNDIVRKFPNINTFHGEELKITNVDCFFESISKYDNIKYLKLTFDQSINKIMYIVKLSNLNQQIKNLDIPDFDIDKSINLEFLYKFNGLVKVSLGKIEDVNIMEYLCEEFKLALKINFEIGDGEKNFQISFTNGEYTLVSCFYGFLSREFNCKFNNCKELMVYLDDLNKNSKNKIDIFYN